MIGIIEDLKLSYIMVTRFHWWYEKPPLNWRSVVPVGCHTLPKTNSELAARNVANPKLLPDPLNHLHQFSRVNFTRYY